MVSIHEQFEKKHGSRISMLSFDFGPEIARTNYSRSYQVSLAKPQLTKYILEKVETARLPDFHQFVDWASLMMQISHPNIIKVHTIFEEEEFLFVVKEFCELHIGSSKDKFLGLTPAVILDLFGHALSAQTYLNSLSLPNLTLCLKPKHLFWSQGALKISRLSSFDRMRSKPLLSYFSVPETESTKDKIEVWNLGVLLLDLCLGFNFEGIPRGEDPTKIAEKFASKATTDPDIKVLLGLTLRSADSRATLDDLRHNKNFAIESPSDVKTSNSFSLDPKTVNEDAGEAPKQSLISFEISNKTSEQYNPSKVMSIRPGKRDKDKGQMMDRLAEIEQRLQSLSEFKRRTEEKSGQARLDAPFAKKDREIIEVMMDKNTKVVRSLGN